VRRTGIERVAGDAGRRAPHAPAPVTRPVTAADIVHDVALEALEHDPYPTYSWMRRHRPIAYVPETRRVWITTWDLCDEAGRNDEVFGPTRDVFHAVYGKPNVMSLTGAEHLAHRSALNACFRPRAVNEYRERLLRATAVRYIDPIRDRGEADASTEILERISMRAIGDVLGFTDVQDDILIRWFHGFAAYLVDFGRSSEVAEHGRAIKAEVAAYLRTRLDPLVAHPDGSTLSHLLHDGMPEGTTRGIEEIIGDVGVMIVGGFQEPAHGAANSLHGLFTRPDQAARLRADPAAWSAAAVEEGLRWLAPFSMTEKLTTADVTLGDVRFPAGTEVAMVLGSANRDETRYADPDVFDLDRPRQSHAAFGYGLHFCLGHFVARQLERVMLEEMFVRLPNLRPDRDQAATVHGWAVRAAKRLPVVWDA
jgi:aromatic O-demethylase, cytochrome P450 subunit